MAKIKSLIDKNVSTEKLAGCFKKYASKNRISVEQALDKAKNMVALEIDFKMRVSMNTRNPHKNIKKFGDD